MTSQGTECAVRSWFTNKDPCERVLGRLVQSSERHHGSSHHSQPAQREELPPVSDNFFSHGLFSEKVGKHEWKSSPILLSCIPSELCCLSTEKMALICRCIYFSLKFPYVSSSFDTPKKITSQRTYMHASHLRSMLIFLPFSFFCKW